jgi:cobyrinic acid a,c-diamide synthase
MCCCLQIAKWLGAPVVLVVDCWAMARSAAALVKGYAEFDPGEHPDA